MDSSQGFEANRSCFPMMNKQAQDKIPSAHGHNSHQVYSSTMQKRKEDPSIPNLNRTSSQTNGISPPTILLFQPPLLPSRALAKGTLEPTQSQASLSPIPRHPCKPRADLEWSVGICCRAVFLCESRETRASVGVSSLRPC